jgi:hypothetical protein
VDSQAAKMVDSVSIFDPSVEIVSHDWLENPLTAAGILFSSGKAR